ncbi:MAG: VWA domain-containing protein [Myxococcales bacterium]|nr:VWA domain-containing protein [Myxococcales bacterium]
MADGNDHAPPPNDSADDSGSGVASLELQQDRTLGRAGLRSHRFVRVVATARHQAQAARRLPLRIAFALDRSGSMAGRKLDLAKEALRTALHGLGPDDVFAVAWFDTNVEVAATAQPATPANVKKTLARCDKLRSGGGTALCAGWQAACEALGPSGGRSVARCVLLTDGQANHGPSDPAVLAELARHARQAGICTSAIGLGQDFAEDLLGRMAAAGDGRFYYAASAADVPRLVATELGEAMEVVARRVELCVRPSAGTFIEVLGDHPAHWTGTELRILLGDLVSDQTVEVALRARLPAGHAGSTASVEVAVFEAGEPSLLPFQSARWTLADAAANDRQLREREVDRLVARLYAARARMQAVGLNRDTHYEAAAAVLHAVAVRIAGYAAGDAELERLVAELHAEVVSFRHDMTEHDRKLRYHMSAQATRSKLDDGTSMRRAPKP